jgi:ATP-dependent exoDNAse (exonuclease V) alpha subunit
MEPDRDVRAGGGPDSQAGGRAHPGSLGWRFAPGDKVMQIANDYEKELFNGDLGSVDSIDADNNELRVVFPIGEAGMQVASLCPHDP